MTCDDLVSYDTVRKIFSDMQARKQCDELRKFIYKGYALSGSSKSLNVRPLSLNEMLNMSL